MTYWNELFNYDHNTGVLSWKKWRRGSKRSLVAGSKECDGCLRVRHKNKHIPDFKDAVAVGTASEIKYNYHENHGS